MCSDLKCSNILISNTNDVRLADFGLARSLDFSQYDDDEVRQLPLYVRGFGWKGTVRENDKIDKVWRINMAEAAKAGRNVRHAFSDPTTVLKEAAPEVDIF